MKFTFFSKCGWSLALARRCETEGNSVNFWCELKGVGNGFIHTVQSPILEPDTILVFDDNKYGPRADEYRRAGYAVIGASTFGHNLAVTPMYDETIRKLMDDYDMPKSTYIEGWFNGNDWVLGMTSICVYDSYHLAGDLGRETGYESGTACFWKRVRPTIFKQSLGKLTSVLKRAGHIGPISVGEKIHGGFSRDSLQGVTSLIPMDCGKLLSDTARGTLKRITPRYDYATTIRVTIPPYPYGSIGLGGREIADRKDFIEVVNPVSVGCNGDKVVAYATTVACSVGIGCSAGKSSQEAKVKIRKASIRETQYRVDAGAYAEKVIPVQLRKDSHAHDTWATTAQLRG